MRYWARLDFQHHIGVGFSLFDIDDDNPPLLDARQQDSQSWLSARTSVFQRERRVSRRRPTPSRRRTGTTSRPQELSQSESKTSLLPQHTGTQCLLYALFFFAVSARPSSTVPLVSRTQTTLSRAGYSRSRSPISRRTRTTLSARSSSASTRSRARTA